MSNNLTDLIARRPRHEATAEIAAEVTRSSGTARPAIHGAVVDISRDGFCLETSSPLEIGESVVVRLQDADADLDLALSATVRWRRHDDDGTWLIGCQTPEPLDWETLGELFLRELLVAE